jgi:hypothetical protein
MAEKLKINPATGELDLIDVYDDATVVKQGGNSFGATMVVGTNDNQPLSLETNNTARATIESSGQFKVLGNHDAQSSGIVGDLVVNNQGITGNNTASILLINNSSSVIDRILLSLGRSGTDSIFSISNIARSKQLLRRNDATRIFELGDTTDTDNSIQLNQNTFATSRLGTNSTRKLFYTDGTVRFFIRSTNQIATDTTNYETLVTSDNDIPNKKYVDDLQIQLRTVTSATYTATMTDSVIEVNSTSNAVQITLPSSITNGKRFFISWVAGANPVTITSPSNLVDIDGVSKGTITIANLQDTYNYFKGSLRYQLF